MINVFNYVNFVLLLIGILILATGFSINEQLLNANKPNVVYLTVIFFVINLLVATQDIVVDGWALTMLKRFMHFFVLLSNSKQNCLFSLFHKYLLRSPGLTRIFYLKIKMNFYHLFEKTTTYL